MFLPPKGQQWHDASESNLAKTSILPLTSTTLTAIRTPSNLRTTHPSNPHPPIQIQCQQRPLSQRWLNRTALALRLSPLCPGPTPDTALMSMCCHLPQQRQHAEANIEAIELLHQLNEENRWATRDEQSTRAQYSAWGACSQIFDQPRADWAELRQRLTRNVDGNTYRRLRGSTLTAYYTSPELADTMWGAIKQAGLTEGKVLEPGRGVVTFSAPRSGRDDPRVSLTV